MIGYGEKIKNLRKEKGLTQEQFADLINIGRSALSLYEIEARQPDPQTLSRIADFFNVSTDYLLCRTDDPTPEKKDDNGFDILREEMKKRGLSPKEVVERILRENKADRIEEVIKELRSIIVDNDYNKDL